MTGLYANILIGVYLTLAAWTIVHAIMKTNFTRVLLGAMLLAELLQLIFTIGGISQMLSSGHPVPQAEFIGYLLGMLVIPPVALWWARGDTPRIGAGIMCTVYLVMPVLVLRVQQVWAGPLG
ncbi:MAG: hypothetical protein Q7L55_00305 [Actinomycetota bacterium]|nr:hypothetical protein [Actinomycetota bacterium]